MSEERWAFFRGAACGVFIMALNTDRWDKAALALASLGFMLLFWILISRAIARTKQINASEAAS